MTNNVSQKPGREVQGGKLGGQRTGEGMCGSGSNKIERDRESTRAEEKATMSRERLDFQKGFVFLGYKKDPPIALRLRPQTVFV